MKDRPGYLKEGAERLSERLDCSVEACRHALKEARIEAKESEFGLDNVSTSEISEFKEFLDSNGISEDDVKSVKFWQTMKGDNRFSVVTKSEGNIMKEVKEEILKNLKEYSPKVEKEYKPVKGSYSV